MQFFAVVSVGIVALLGSLPEGASAQRFQDWVVDDGAIVTQNFRGDVLRLYCESDVVRAAVVVDGVATGHPIRLTLDFRVSGGIMRLNASFEPRTSGLGITLLVGPGYFIVEEGRPARSLSITRHDTGSQTTFSLMGLSAASRQLDCIRS